MVLHAYANFRPIGPTVQPAECKQTDRQTLLKILPLLLTQEVKKSEGKILSVMVHSNLFRIPILLSKAHLLWP